MCCAPVSVRCYGANLASSDTRSGGARARLATGCRRSNLPSCAWPGHTTSRGEPQCCFRFVMAYLLRQDLCHQQRPVRTRRNCAPERAAKGGPLGIGCSCGEILFFFDVGLYAVSSRDGNRNAVRRACRRQVDSRFPAAPRSCIFLEAPNKAGAVVILETGR